MTQSQIHDRIAYIEQQQREICRQYGIEILQHEPREPAQTGYNRTLTRPRKSGIIGIIAHIVRKIGGK